VYLKDSPAPEVAAPPQIAPPARGVYARFGKRAFDIAFAGLALILLSPAFLAAFAAAAVSGKPSIFSHARVGRNGWAFACLKFRTMTVDADAVLQRHLRDNPDAMDEWARARKLRHDPRITGFGACLRATSLDEVPQFWNVLTGQMSVVGPRPVTAAELEHYGARRDLVLSVRPGITGLWQVSGRNETTYDERVRLDEVYVRTLSLRLDLWIALKTIPVILSKTGR